MTKFIIAAAVAFAGLAATCGASSALTIAPNNVPAASSLAQQAAMNSYYYHHHHHKYPKHRGRAEHGNM